MAVRWLWEDMAVHHDENFDHVCGLAEAVEAFGHAAGRRWGGEEC